MVQTDLTTNTLTAISSTVAFNQPQMQMTSEQKDVEMQLMDCYSQANTDCSAILDQKIELDMQAQITQDMKMQEQVMNQEMLAQESAMMQNITPQTSTVQNTISQTQTLNAPLKEGVTNVF